MTTFLGQDVPKLGFGLMRLPMRGGRVDMTQVTAMVDHFMAHGFTYFDTAYSYQDCDSERMIGEVLVKRYPRERYQLATKLPIWQLKEPADMARVFQESLARTGAGYFDYYLLHSLDEYKAQQYEDLGAWQFVGDMKARGLIKHIGFSFHDTADHLEALLLKHPEVEFVQLQINYGDWENPIVQSRRCYEVARRYEKPIVIMEPVKGGSLVNLMPAALNLLREANPQLSPAGWALRFCASLPGVITVLSGMSDLRQMEDNVATMAQGQSLTARERDVLQRVAAILQAIPTIPCTNCRYCVDDCSQKIKIPLLLSILNDLRLYHNEAQALESYQWETKGFGKASDCLDCGTCEERCPQHLAIPALLREVAAALER